MTKARSIAVFATACLSLTSTAHAFCGFYVAKADTKLFNEASKVVIARHDDRTVLTMVNDYRGDPQEFAMVVPVPTFIERGQIHVGKQAVVDHLDAFSAPRLVEYHDPDPCRRMERYDLESSATGGAMLRMAAEPNPDAALGVVVEAEYTVGEYDIVILSAEQSDGLETWLRESGYRIPDGASRVLGSYIKQGMRFFVAKVNLEEKAKLGELPATAAGRLRNSQVHAADSPRHGERRRPPGAVRVRPHPQRPGGDHELSDGSIALGHGRPAIREERIRKVLP